MSALLKITAVPNETSVPEIVPTTALPLLTAVSLKTKIHLFNVESKHPLRNSIPFAAIVTSVPKVIELSLGSTVPTRAVA